MIRNGQFFLSIAEDGMTAFATFKPPASGGNALELADIEAVLISEELVFGIDWEQIRTSLYRCSKEHINIERVVIAKGLRPVPQVPACLLFAPSIQNQSRIFRQIDSKGEYHPISTDDNSELVDCDAEEHAGRVDHRERNSVQVIHQGQVLAKRLPLRPGRFGTNVCGEQIPFEEVKLSLLRPGQNTEEKDGRVISQISGRLVWDKEQFGVDSNIEISGEVGYATGNIRFPGNVLLKGEIQDGFRIWSGGNIYSKATIDATEIFCKGDLRSTEGILGRNGGLVRVKGEIEAKFIENCRVDAFGSIHIKHAVMGSSLNTLADINLEKGKAVGGRFCFGGVMKAAQLGNEAGVRTVCNGGVNFIQLRQLEHAQQRLAELSSAGVSADSRPTGGALIPKATQAQIERELTSLQNEISRLLEATQAAGQSCLEVSGVIFPGTVIRFGSLERIIQEKLQGKRFRPSEDQVLVESLSED